MEGFWNLHIIYYSESLPSTSIITMYECDNLDDEKQKLETVIEMIRFEEKDFKIENKYQWIFLIKI